MVYNHYSWTKGGRIYEIPSDWTAYLIYNVGYGSGSITVKSWLDQYTEDDISKIDTVWQPTGTYWVNQTQLALDKQL